MKLFALILFVFSVPNAIAGKNRLCGERLFHRNFAVAKIDPWKTEQWYTDKFAAESYNGFKNHMILYPCGSNTGIDTITTNRRNQVNSAPATGNYFCMTFQKTTQGNLHGYGFNPMIQTDAEKAVKSIDEQYGMNGSIAKMVNPVEFFGTLVPHVDALNADVTSVFEEDCDFILFRDGLGIR